MPATSDLPTPADEVARLEAFGVLRDALNDLAHLGRPATASEARLRIKRRTYDGFDLGILGYKRFRDFLDAAEAAGYIEIDDERKGDVAVRLPGAIYDQVEDGGTSRRIRHDLWRAVSDWEGKSTHVVDLPTNRVISFPLLPVPLEPAEFADLRDRLRLNDANLIPVAPVPQTTQVEWMRKFADDTGIEELRAVFSTVNPIEQFMTIVRSDPEFRRDWSRVLSEHVRHYIGEWKSKERGAAGFNPFESPESVRSAQIGPGPTTEHVIPRAVKAAVREHIVPRSGRTWHVGASGNVTYVKSRLGSGSQIRQILHAAIDRMPDNELRNINIPVGYLFDED